MKMTLKELRDSLFPFTRKKHISKIKPGDVVVYDDMLYLVTDVEYIVINKITGFNIGKALYFNHIHIKLDCINSSESYYRVLLSTKKLRKLLESIYSSLSSPICVSSETQMYIYINKTKHGYNLLQYSNNAIQVSLDVRCDKYHTLKQVTNIPSYIRDIASKSRNIVQLMLLYLNHAIKRN